MAFCLSYLLTWPILISSKLSFSQESGQVRDLNQAWDLYYHVFRRISRQLPQLTSLELQYVSTRLLNCRDLELAVPGSYVPMQDLIRIAHIQSSLQVSCTLYSSSPVRCLSMNKIWPCVSLKIKMKYGFRFQSLKSHFLITNSMVSPTGNHLKTTSTPPVHPRLQRQRLYFPTQRTRGLASRRASHAIVRSSQHATSGWSWHFPKRSSHSEICCYSAVDELRSHWLGTALWYFTFAYKVRFEIALFQIYFYTLELKNCCWKKNR